MPIANCRSCGSDELHVILDLGAQPIANALLSEEELSRPEAKFALAVAFCPACALLQVTETVPADILYRRDYPYFSSSSPALLKHSAEHVEALVCKYGLGPLSFVVEVASNDGYYCAISSNVGFRASGSIRLTVLWLGPIPLACRR